MNDRSNSNFNSTTSDHLLSTNRTSDNSKNVKSLYYAQRKLSLKRIDQHTAVKTEQSLSSFRQKGSMLSVQNQNSTKSSPRTHHEELEHRNQELRNQKKNRMNNLMSILKDRKQTFLKFGFRGSELNEPNSGLRTLVKDLNGQQPKGTMNVNELWPDQNILNYVRAQRFSEAKRTFKRLGLIGIKNDQLNANQGSDKQGCTSKVFTSKDESELKIKLTARNAQKHFRNTIKEKFKNDGSIFKLLLKKEKEAKKKKQNFITEMDPNELLSQFKNSYDKIYGNFKMMQTMQMSNSNQNKKSSMKPYLVKEQKQDLQKIISRLDMMIDSHREDKKDVDTVLDRLEKGVLKYRPKQAN